VAELDAGSPERAASILKSAPVAPLLSHLLIKNLTTRACRTRSVTPPRPGTPRADRLAYCRDIISVFKAEDVAYANWEYKGDFGIYEWLGLPGLCGAPDSELIGILAPKTDKKDSR
jgi:hypothetical protein